MRRPLRFLVLPLMLGTATLYFTLQLVMHSPLRQLAAVLVGVRSSAVEVIGTDSLWMQRAAVSATAFLALIVVFLAARTISSRARAERYERWLLFGLTVFALITIPAAFIGGLGSLTNTGPLRPPLGPLLVAVPAGGILVYGIRHRWHLGPDRIPGKRLGRLPAAFLGLAVALLAISSAVSLAHPPNGYDALAYHAPLAVYFWRSGNLDAFLSPLVEAGALAHPGAGELWYGFLLMLGGEAAANLGQLPFALLGALAVRAFARRLGLGDGAAILGGAAFLLAPIVVVQAGMQLNDVAAAALVMVAVALAASHEWTPGRFAWIGLALGLAGATKLATLPRIAGILGFVVVLQLRGPDDRRARRAVGRGLLILSTVLLLVLAPWWVRNTVHYGNPIYPAALPFVGSGSMPGDAGKKDEWFVPRRMAWPLYPLLEPHNDQSGFGALFVVGAVPGLAFALLRRRRHASWLALPRRREHAPQFAVPRTREHAPQFALRHGRRHALLLYGMVVAVTLPAWWIFSQHEPRLIIALFGIAFAFVGYALVAVPRPWRRKAGALLLGTACLSALVTLFQALLPIAREPSVRSEFYDQIWGIDPVVLSLPDSVGLLYHMGYARLSYAGDYPLLGRSLQREILPVDGEIAADSIVALMRRTGFRHAYVPAAPEFQAMVRQQYSPVWFDVTHTSVVADGSRRGTQRQLFQLKDAAAEGATPGAAVPPVHYWSPWTRP